MILLEGYHCWNAALLLTAAALVAKLVCEKRKPRDDVVEGAHDETKTRDGGEERLQAVMASTITRAVKSAARRGEKERAVPGDPRDAVAVGVRRAVRTMGGRS